MDMLEQKKILIWRSIKILSILLAIVTMFVIFTYHPAYSQELNIVNPMDGAIFSPGETITVIVEPGAGISLELVMIRLKGAWKAKPIIDRLSPFEIPVTLPNKIGSVVLEAYGIDQTEHEYSTQITLTLETTSSLQEIRVSPKKLNFEFLSDRSLVVKGLYLDGTTIKITSPKTGTTYEMLSGNNGVVEVFPWGRVVAKGNGQDTIIVSNNGITKAVPVVVQVTNSQPNLSSVEDVLIEAGTTLDIPISATDLDEEDIIILSGDNLPTFVQVLDNGNRTGILHIAPNGNDIGAYSGIYISALDNGNPVLGDSQKITIQVTAPLVPGDLNSDGDIDPADRSIFLANYGKCNEEITNSLTDYDGDGCVTGRDYRIWYGYYRSQ